MASKRIPTARARWFDDPQAALTYAEGLGSKVVVKVDGLAAGKGVTVCDDAGQARTAIDDAMVARRFGEAGARVLIEERLHGPELSILAFVDGKSVLPMAPAQDFKRIFDGDEGPNTGGMGSYSPVPVCTPQVSQQVVDQVLEPIAEALLEQGENYVGVIYAGLMLSEAGLRVIEFNCRFGDPETQAIPPRLTSDLAEVMSACVEGCLPSVKLEWSNQACVCVVAASPGYPVTTSAEGAAISGVAAAEQMPGVSVFHSGTKLRDGTLVTAGGRVLSVSALGENLAEAQKRAYQALKHISFEGMQHRTDIASAAARQS